MPDPFVRKLRHFRGVTNEEESVLAGAISCVREAPANHDLVFEGDHPSECLLVLEGFACRYTLLGNGRRQIISFEVAGDLCDFHSFFLGEADYSISTLTPCRLGLIPHSALQAIIQDHQSLAQVLWRDTLAKAAILQVWLTNVGQRTAYERIAHLFCEMLLRLEAVGLAEDGSFALPITQQELGDALGLSNVHVNRTLRELRANGLIVLRGGSMTVLDREALEQAAGFDPAYLHFGGRSEPDFKRTL